MVIDYEKLSKKDIQKELSKEVYQVGKTRRYSSCLCAFDIETTTKNEYAYMYIWQFQLNEYTILGRTWDEFEEFISILVDTITDYKLLVWIANAGYEFQFIRKRFNITRMFAKEMRHPLLFEIDEKIEFRDALAITNSNLAQLAKDYCNTQKMVGDLDYSIERNSTTVLSAEELKYCENDVVILKEFAEFIFNTFLPLGYIPITSTSILRKEVEREALKWCRKKKMRIDNLRTYVRGLFPPTEARYKYIMEFLFRGGFTHANKCMVDRTLYNLKAIDYTSSYPAVMFNCYVPITRFETVPFKPSFLTTKCCIMTLRFTNIYQTTDHSIESKSKIIDYTNAEFDNGRLMSADSLTVMLTELDLENYDKFYEWDEFEVLSFEIAERGYLPTYLLDVLYNHYATKQNLKKQGKNDTVEYAIAKARANSAYGMTVTRINFKDVFYENDEWTTGDTNTSYSEKLERQVLSPYWGIYITAHARNRELDSLYNLTKLDGVYVAYSDTDSHKFIDMYGNGVKWVESFNSWQEAKNKTMCEKYGYDFNVLQDIGCFEFEKDIRVLKSLGTKRYILVDDKFKQTISGLSKSAMVDYYRANRQILKRQGKSIFDIFEHCMEIPSEYTGKLTAIYQDCDDLPCRDIIDGEVMTELSCLYLKPTEFHLSIADEYMEIINKIMQQAERRF